MNVILNPGEIMFDEDINMWLRYKLGHRLIQEIFLFTVSILLPCRELGICQDIKCVYTEKQSKIHTLLVKFRYLGLIIISLDMVDPRILQGWMLRDWHTNICKRIICFFLLGMRSIIPIIVIPSGSWKSLRGEDISLSQDVISKNPTMKMEIRYGIVSVL